MFVAVSSDKSTLVYAKENKVELLKQLRTVKFNASFKTGEK